VEAFERGRDGDRGVKIEAGGEAGTEGEGDGLERIHGGPDIQFNRGGVGRTKVCGSRKQKADSEPSGKRWVRNDNCAVAATIN